MRENFSAKVTQGDLDRFATEVAKRYAAGDLEKREACIRIFNGIVQSGVIAWRVHAYIPGGLREDALASHDELVADVTELIYQFMDADSPRFCFNIELPLNGRSVKSWAMNTTRTIVSRIIKDRREKLNRRRTVTVDHSNLIGHEVADHDDRGVGARSFTGYIGGRMSDIVHVGKSAGHIDKYGGLYETVESRRYQVADIFQDKTLSNLRGSRLLTAQYCLARYLNGVTPHVIAPAGESDRKFLRDVLEQHPALALRSAQAMAAIHDGEVYDTGLDERLLSLWDDFRRSDIDAVLLGVAPEQTAYVLAMYALSPKPKPSKREVSSAISALKRRAGSASWAVLVPDLVECFIARMCEPLSTYVAVDDAEARRVVEEARAKGSRYESLACEVARQGMAPSADEVTGLLYQQIVPSYDGAIEELDRTLQADAS